MMYCSSLRPHQGLRWATPAEVYFDESPACERAVPPPRKTAGPPAGDESLPLEVVFLDFERRMPVLVPLRRAA